MFLPVRRSTIASPAACQDTDDSGQIPLAPSPVSSQAGGKCKYLEGMFFLLLTAPLGGMRCGYRRNVQVKRRCLQSVCCWNRRSYELVQPFLCFLFLPEDPRTMRFIQMINISRGLRDIHWYRNHGAPQRLTYWWRVALNLLSERHNRPVNAWRSGH